MRDANEYGPRVLHGIPVELDYVHVAARDGLVTLTCAECHGEVSFAGARTLGKLCDIMSEHMRVSHP